MAQPDVLKTGREHNRIKVQGLLAGKTDEEIKEDRAKGKTPQAFFTPALGAIKKAKGGLAEGERFLKKEFDNASKTDKEKVFGNLNTLARDVSQNFVNITKSGTATGYVFKQDPTDLGTDWAKWGNNPRPFSTLGENSSKQEVEEMFQEFEELLKTSETWVKNE